MRCLNCNNYIAVPEHEATFKIVPMKLKDGTQPPPIWLRHKGSKGGVKAEDLENTVWEPSVKLDLFQDTRDYKDCIHWWFREMAKDDEYKTGLVEIYGEEYKSELRTELIKIKKWLIDNAGFRNRNGKYTKRKKDINMFVTRWLNKPVRF